MSSIVKYIRLFAEKEFHQGYCCSILLLISALIYFNYQHGLEHWLVQPGSGFGRSFAGYYVLYAVPFILAFVLQRWFYAATPYFFLQWFWVIVLLAPAFFAFRVSFRFHEPLVKGLVEASHSLFWLKCISLLLKVLLVLLPVVVIWYVKDRKLQPFYGCKPIDRWQPYGWMLLIMAPLIVLAASQHDFQLQYPKASHLGIANGSVWRYLLYECCYGVDFVSIEFFFRGFLILSMVHFAGAKAIIPAACFYCSIHLGKPMAEAISSFWGGILLGIVAYNTGSIRGGLLVHIGIAWMMELAGWLVPMF